MKPISILVLLAGCVLTEKERQQFEECMSDRPDEVTITEPTCVDATTGSLELREVWANDDHYWARALSVTRSVDVDGDGDVDGGDPMGVWASMMIEHRDPDENIVMLDHDGVVATEFAYGAYGAHGYSADIDPDDAGSEFVVSWNVWRADTFASALTEGAESWVAVQPSGTTGLPVVTDLEDDGVLEVIVGGEFLSSVDGLPGSALDGSSVQGAQRVVAVDLDRDGVREILGGNKYRREVALYDADGSVRALCWEEDFSRTEHLAFAVGNFDADDDGEFVAAGTGFLALCDTDGTLLASVVDDALVQPGITALGQLDQDPELEIVIGDSNRLVAFEHDLTPKWEYADEEYAWYVPTLVDLDLDGRHEVVVLHEQLLILGGDGSLLASTVLAGDGSSWLAQPVIADVDGDGLAEIAVPGHGRVTLLENEHGGWNIPEARYPWAGNDRHPAQQDVDGSILPASAWWLEEGGNVFNGMPAGPARIPELAVSVEDVCVQCGGESAVVVAVSNVGAGAAMGNVSVVVTSTLRGDELARGSVPTPLEEGVKRYVVVPVPSDRLGDGLTVTVGTDDAVGECDLVENVATWDASPCAF